MVTVVRSAPAADRGAGDGRHVRRLRHSADWAVRIATLAAGLCPTLSSLAGAVVAVLIALPAGRGVYPGRHTAVRRQQGHPAATPGATEVS